MNPFATLKHGGGVERGNKTFREDFYASSDLLTDTITTMRSALQQAIRKYNNSKLFEGYSVSFMVNPYNPELIE